MSAEGEDFTEPQFDEIRDGVTPIVDLTRPAPGWQRCCICFTARPIHELLQDATDNRRWDVCSMGTCAEEAGLRR